ncbi:MAG: transposase [Alphaproteobacteria bacterium]
MNETTIIGIDLSKRFMQVCVIDGEGTPMEEVRVARDRLVETVTRHGGAMVAMAACGGAHHWGRTLARLGHAVRLIAPSVAKGYRDPACKDDRRDARAIAEAGGRRHARPTGPAPDSALAGLRPLGHTRRAMPAGAGLRPEPPFSRQKAWMTGEATWLTRRVCSSFFTPPGCCFPASWGRSSSPPDW